MPLSEQEQRLLEEMERNLYHNDADFVATVGARRGRPNYSVLVAAVLVVLLGIATLIVGVVVRQPIVGVIGFAIMFGGVLLAVTPPRKAIRPAEPQVPKSAQRQHSSFMDGLSDRWEKRQDGRDH